MKSAFYGQFKKSLLVTVLVSILGFSPLSQAQDIVVPESDAVRVGDLLFISGQGGGETSDPNDTAEKGIKESLDKIQKIVTANGGSMNDIVKLDVYLLDLNRDFFVLNEVLPMYFHEPYPTRVTVGARIPKNHTVEISAIMKVHSKE